MHLNQITLQCTDVVYILEFDSMLLTQIRKKENSMRKSCQCMSYSTSHNDQNKCANHAEQPYRETYNCCIPEGCGVKSGKGVGMIIITHATSRIETEQRKWAITLLWRHLCDMIKAHRACLSFPPQFSSTLLCLISGNTCNSAELPGINNNNNNSIN